MPIDTIILAILAGTAVCCLALFFLTTSQDATKKRIWRRDGDSAGQLRHVMAGSFYKKKIMNRAEYRVFRTVELAVAAQRNGHRVLSQTSLGEIIGSNDAKAFFAINSKRVDVLVIGPYGDPVAVFEYQGTGHHQGNAAARDAIKREALRKAGVQFIEVLESHSNDEVVQMVRKLFQVSRQAA